MPKIRVKRVTSTYLEKFLEKSYNTVNNTTTFTTSGILNSNFKKTMLKKFNTAGKYFRIQQVSSEGNLSSEADPYNDTLTIEFIENQKNIRPLNLPAVKIQNSNDYYITSEEYLLGLNEIPESILGELHDGMKVSDFIVENPSFIDFESYQEQSTSKNKNISLISERYKEDNFVPFKDVDVFSNVSQSFIEDSFIYKDEEYNVGNEKRIEIELDFTDSSDAFLLNTQLFYKTNRFFDLTFFNEPAVLPDDVFVTEQVNFIDQGNARQSITSHLLPNMLWNNVENRWEYNVVNDNLLKLNPFLYNKALYNADKTVEFPNLITHSYEFGTINNEDKTDLGIFDQLNYIANTPVAFSSFHDNNNNLKNSSKKSYLHNVPTRTYGFPNGNLWKTKKSHSIKLSNYIPSDFLLEKVIFEGKLDIKAELPNAKGNLVNNNQDYSIHPTLSDRVPDDSKIFSNDEEFNEEYKHRDFASGYIASGVNFYILNKIKEERPIEYFNAIEGYTFRRKSDNNSFSNFTLTENDEANPYVDINLSDLLLKDKIDKLQGDLIAKNYTDNRQIIPRGVRNSIYNNLSKDEYNNFYLDRLSTNYFYLDNTDLSEIDVDTKNYFSIISNEGINHNTNVYNTLSTNDFTKEFKLSNDSDVDLDCYNELVSQNSIGFVKINRAVNELPIDVTAQDAEALNTDELQVEYTTNDSMFIDVKNYEFNISSNISSNNSRSEIGENSFNVLSNYRYNKVTPESSEFSYFEDGITVFEEPLKEKEIRNIYKSKEQSSNKTDIVSDSGKVLDKNISCFSKEKVGYLIKNSDELAVGINSFTGFNNIISYARLKDKLKIVLIGREVEAKSKNESFESSSIKKSFFGNQRIEMLQRKDKSGKYFQKLQSLNKNYISDSIMPSIVDIFYEFAQKQAVTASTKDSLNYYISMNDYGRINDSITPVNKLIVSNKNLGDDEKYSNILTDWHKKYYMSVFKDNDAVKIKQIKNQSALLKERKVLGETYLYFDTNSYSLTSKYDKATKRYFDDIVKNANNETQAINQNLISTINEFIVPKEYHVKTSITDHYYSHSGAKLLYNKTDQTSYELTKDSISQELLRSDDLIFSFSTLATAENASIQYLNIPGSIPTLVNQNKDYLPNVKGQNYKGSWALVFEDPEILNNIDLLSYKDIKSKISHYEKFSEGNSDIEILHDNTFSIVSSSKVFGMYNHNFYIAIKTENNQEKLFFILPLPYVYYESNSDLTINTGEDIFYNEFFGINFSGMGKDDFESTGSTVYNKLPLTYTEMFSNTDPQDDFDQQYNFATQQYNSSYFQVGFYKNNIILKHPKNANLTNYIRNVSKDDIFTKNEFPIYKLSTLERFDLIERKAFSVNKEYFSILDSVKNSSNKDLFLNKIISESHIYKKKGNRFVKTQNKILYEVFNEKSYGSGDSKTNNTFINIISVMSKDGNYLNNEIENNLVYDLDKKDVIRIYDEKIMEYNKKYNMNFDIPYIEIDLFSINNKLDIKPTPDFTPDFTPLAIKYSHYSVDNFDEIPEDTITNSLTSYGSPIAHINNIDKINRFMFTYSRNKKYNFPIDQTSGYRYGVHSHMPVNVSYTFNTNHYGQFKDRSYDSQNYSLTRIVNGKVYTDYCVNKEFVNEFFRKIDESVASNREMFSGSNLDIHDRYYHPYIESNDNSDMSHMYT